MLAGQREFRERLSEAGIPHESHEEPGGHVFRPNMFVLDLDGIIARLRLRAAAWPQEISPIVADVAGWTNLAPALMLGDWSNFRSNEHKTQEVPEEGQRYL